MTREEYLVLFEKYIAGQATPEEVDMIMSQADKFHLTNIHPEEDKEHYQAIEDRILNRLNDEIAPRKVSLWHRINWRIAAAVTLFAVAGTILLTYKKANQPNLSVENQVALDKVVKPGSNKALLTLANGKSIVLNDGTSATILKQGNLTVKKQKDGLLQYQITASVPANKAQVEYHHYPYRRPISGSIARWYQGMA
jgi:transmembrane sensor